MAIYDDWKLFKYSTNGEVIIPDTLEVKNNVIEMFRNVFGTNFDISDSSPNGRLIEALTVMLVNIYGVIAQNTNGLNPNLAVGNWLDVIGAIFGVSRDDGETDEKYRIRIKNSQSRGKGFVQSIWNAVNNVDGVTSVCVLENGYEDPYTFPDTGFTIAPHSIFVCCKGGTDSAVAEAIYSSKSAGCGYHEPETQEGEGEGQDEIQLNQVKVDVNDQELGVSTEVIFYRPTKRNVRFEVTVRGDAYTGTDIVGDTKSIITNYMSGRDANSVTTKADIISAIGVSRLGIVCTGVTIEVQNPVNTTVWNSVERLVVFPYQFISVTNDSTTVNV